MERLKFNTVPVVLLSAALASFGGFAVGCGGSGNGETAQTQADPMEAAAGVYDMDRTAIRQAMQDEIDQMSDGPDKMGMNMAMGMIDSMEMTLTLNADGSAAMNMSMMGQTEEGSGTWELDGESISITVAPEGEEPETINGTLENGRLTLIPPEDEEAPFDMIFIKRDEAAAGEGDDAGE